MKKLNPIMISGKEVFPLIEGGKGINGSDGRSSGAWAHENCVGTFSGVSPDYYDESGHVIFEKYFKKTVENVMPKWLNNPSGAVWPRLRLPTKFPAATDAFI